MLTINSVTADDTVNAAEIIAPITIAGTSSAPAGSIVTLTIDNQPIGTPQVLAGGAWSFVFDASTFPSASEGPHTLRASTTSEGTASMPFDIDTLAPTLQSLVPSQTLTNQATVTFTATFSEPVTGVTAANFTIDPSSTDTAASIASVSGGGTSYTVTVNTGGAGHDGTIALSLNGATIKDVAGNGFAPDAFGTQATYATGTWPHSVAVGDVNNDGRLDLVTANFSGHSVSVLLGNGDGTFQPATDIPVGSGQFAGTNYVAVDDFNRDGKRDIVAVNENDGSISLLLGNGNGTFQAPITTLVGSGPTSNPWVVVTGDINRDGNADIIVSNEGDDAVSVLLGNGDGTFQTLHTYAAGATPGPMAIGDLNGDGEPDLVVGQEYSDQVFVLLGAGAGTFAAPSSVAAGTGVVSVALADLDHDGKLDLVTANSNSNTASVLLGNGDGTFQTAQSYTIGSNPTSIKVADVNGDGLGDLIVGVQSDYRVSILLGNGNGSFQTAVSYAMGSAGTLPGPWDLAVGDLNGDGRIDIAGAVQETSVVSVLLNGAQTTSHTQAGEIVTLDTIAPTLTVTGIAPDTGSSSADGLTATAAVTVSGTIDVADAGRTITVFNGTTNLGTTTANGSGQWSLAITLAAGANSLTAQATDEAGNTGTSAAFIATLDTQAPNLTIDGIAPDTGSSGTDGLTSAAAVTVSGTIDVADAGRTITVFNGTTNLGTTTANGSGQWSLAITLAAGANSLTAQATDEAGNTGTSAAFTATLDTQAPATPAAPVLASDTGTVGDTITADPTITYPTPALGDVLLYSLDGGSFSDTAPTFATDGSSDGVHTVAIEERDAAGNTSVASSLTFTLDTQAPATPAAPVLASDTGTPGDTITSDPTITYPTPALGDVLLYSLDGASFSATAPTFATDGSSDGTHTIAIKEQDTAGNISDGAASLIFTLDTQAPATPASPVLANDTGAPGDTVTKDPTISYPTPALGDMLLYSLDGGSFSDTAPTFATDGSSDGTHTVAIKEQDTAGNISDGAASLVFTLDTQAPATPTAPVLANDTGRAGDFVTRDPTIAYPSPAAGDALLYSLDGGSFSDTAPTFATDGSADGLHIVSITERDEAGNISGASSLTFMLDTAIHLYQWAASGDLGRRGDDYHVAGVGDFNGDGTADVLWSNAAGEVDEWTMANGQWSASLSLGSHGAGWTVAAIGDFDGDGTSDVLWREAATGKLDAWIMQDDQWSRSQDLGSHGTDWKVIGAGDFNGDGTSDILFQNTTTGAVDQWVMSNGNWSKSISLGSHNTAYTTAAIGDFDDDGTDDVLWQNPTTGAVDEWHMIDGNWANSVDLGSHNPAYELAAVNDFNGDGTSDVLWRNTTTGAVDGWVMFNGEWFTSVSLGSLDPAYRLAGAGDFDHAGGADVLWHNAATGETGTWLLDAI
jgi:hypothetical protein